MFDYEAVLQALRSNRYQARLFSAGAEAAAYLDGEIDHSTVGLGDSLTLASLGLPKLLARHNTVYDPATAQNRDEFLAIAKKCLLTDYFITSVNALTVGGIIVNLDGAGNRVAGSMFGHKKVFHVLGKNKLAPDLDQAIRRVRNVAAPANAARHRYSTPCALTGKCHDCSSPDRICNGLFIQYKCMKGLDTEIILIDEDLGL